MQLQQHCYGYSYDVALMSAEDTFNPFFVGRSYVSACVGLGMGGPGTGLVNSLNKGIPRCSLVALGEGGAGPVRGAVVRGALLTHKAAQWLYTLAESRFPDDD